MEGYMTIPKLARQLGMAENTVRRYTKTYSQFFEPKMVEGWEHYPVEETSKLVKRISEVSGPGKKRAEVVAELEREFEVVVAAVDEVEAPEGGFDDGGVRVVEFGPESMAVLKRIAKALEAVTGNAQV